MIAFMRRLRPIVAAIATVALIGLGPVATSAAADTTSSLVKRLAATGLGCKKIIKTESILLGKRVTCTVKGERVAIEVFAARDFKKATSLACAMGFRYIAVTDGKTWTIVPSTRSTATLVGKAMQASVKTFCSKGAIINGVDSANDGSNTTGTPSPKPSTPTKGSVSSPYSLGDQFSIGDYRVTVLSQTADATQAVCDSFQGRSLVPDLCSAEYDSNFNVLVQVNSSSPDRYVQWTLEVSNTGKDIAYLDSDLLVQMTTSSGSLQYQDLGLFSNGLVNWNASLIPGGSATVNVFYKVPKSASLSPLLVVRSLKYGVSTVAYVSAS